MAAPSVLALLLAVLCGVALSRTVDEGSRASVLVSDSTLALPPPRNSTAALWARGDGRVELKLCECERATGPPAGLSCDKEGWFISSFERQGSWVAGGGFVPLSHAICCRPCLPDELPPDPSGRIPGGQAPLAIISLGCHASTDVLGSRCEGGAGSFVAGWSEAVKVFTTPDTFYPVNTAQCCTPALLLENGDAWELERCNCHDSVDHGYPVSCGGTTTDELLLGFIYFRMSPLGHVVPVGPAQCCKACLSGTVHPMNQCDDLNSCSGRGVCNMRRCECFDGWTGPDCSQAVSGGHSIPPWAIALIVLSSSALAGMFIIAAGYALNALGVSPRSPAGSEDGDAEERQPLLIRIDADDAGSVGSADTSDGENEDEVDIEEVERRVNSAIARLDQAAAADGRPAGAPAAEAAAAGGRHGNGAGPEPGSQSASPASLGDEQEAAAGAAASCPGSPAAAAAGAPAGAEQAAMQQEQQAQEAAAAAAAEGQEPQKGGRCGALPEGPLAMVDCSVCMSRPVQVVVVPCGHVCMCRRCSRRLNRCPICRKEIARRQRLFV